MPAQVQKVGETQPQAGGLDKGCGQARAPCESKDEHSKQRVLFRVR